MTAIEPRQRLQETPSLEEDYELLKQASRDAGALALSYFRQQISVNRKPDGSEVSEADKERLKHRRVWMVDPIDGTNAFLRHVPEWTISAALVEDGAPVLGVVFNPATKQ